MNFETLNWNLNFKHLAQRFKDWAETEPNWKTNLRPNGTWAMIPTNILYSFAEFNILDRELAKQGLRINDAVLRLSMPGTFLGIHIDDCENVQRQRVPLELSLNLPLENEGYAVTRWYNFSNHPTLVDDMFVYGKQPVDSPLRAITQNTLQEYLSYCVESTIMSSPMIIRTSVPHNVDTRFFNKERYIISLRIKDIDTNEFVSWDNKDRLLSIKI